MYVTNNNSIYYIDKRTVVTDQQSDEQVYKYNM